MSEQKSDAFNLPNEYAKKIGRMMAEEFERGFRACNENAAETIVRQQREIARLKKSVEFESKERWRATREEAALRTKIKELESR